VSAVLDVHPAPAATAIAATTAPAPRARADDAADAPVVDVVLVGARGQVGSALRALLAREAADLPRRAGLRLRLRAAFDRRGLAEDPAGLDPLAPAFAPRREGDWPALRARLQAGGAPTLLLDCTASDAIADEVPALLAAGIGVVAANKRANARRHADWAALQALARRHRVPWRYETTAGAAIPVLGPLRALRVRGERVLRLEGVLSGSLSHVLGRLQAGARFSDAVLEARALGLTEPDPREDLGGQDLARKLLVLAREAGFAIEPEDVRVRPLAALDDRPLAAALAALPRDDAGWAEWAARAAAAGRRLVALARVDASGGEVGVVALDADDPLARLAPGENRLRVVTEFQHAPPLLLGGPGAGPQVTAAGVLGDALAAARALLDARGG
jgi:aspartokinase/homoserine dehydrogenase 1